MLTEIRQRKLEKLFRVFDALFSFVDNDGLLSKKQYKAFQLAWRNSDADAEEAFLKLGANMDGSISHLELYTILYFFFISDRDNDKSQIFFGKLDQLFA